ncbi:hypothetical protein QZH41_008230 [Actinostola sp. cb2023]|nr:hypothetical protein QZH41_008230 [Actinostola sp. cb2023]
MKTAALQFFRYVGHDRSLEIMIDHDTMSKRAIKDKKMEQMYLDLGQRNFGHVTCTRCGMVYTHAQPDDEIDHIRHHKKFVNGLRFNGWKDEHVVKEFNDGRIIMVKPDDHPSHLKKAEEIRKVVDSELGFAVDLPYRKNESKTFLFIAKKRVVGCCVATQIDKGYPVLPSTPTKDSTPDRQIAAWCCRTHFIYGCVITKDVLAFSDPTPDGKRLATAYIGIPEFLVFH